MDQVRENGVEELHDIGICRAHNRLFECYCTLCHCLICPSCLMFDTHKGHQVAQIEEGSRMLRETITTCSREGLLKFERTQNFLLDIRHAKLTVEDNKTTVMQQVQNSFDQLIATLQQRKFVLIQQLKQHYDQQLSRLQEKETIWMDKQEKAEKVLVLQKSNDQLKLIENAKFIVESLNDLKASAEKQTIKLVGKLDTNITFGNQVVVISQLTEKLRLYANWQIAATKQIRS